MAAQYKYNLHVRAHFEASHTLDWHDKCSALHGHTYHVEVTVGANQLCRDGIVVDLAILKAFLLDILPDHRHLSSLSCPQCGLCLEEGWIINPTVERIAEYIGVSLNTKLADAGYKRYQASVAKVTVWETPTGGVTVAW